MNRKLAMTAGVGRKVGSLLAIEPPQQAPLRSDASGSTAAPAPETEVVRDVRLVNRARPKECYLMGFIGSASKRQRITGVTASMSPDFESLAKRVASEVEARGLTKAEAIALRDRLNRR